MLARRIIFLASLITLPAALPGQSLDLSLTDPDDIIAQCGGDSALGQIAFEANCAACHEIGEDAQSVNGPHLQEMFGRQIGSVPDWTYSDPLVQAGADGTYWEREPLHLFLEDPAQIAPGYALDHPTVMDDQDRRDILTYLRLNTRPAPPEIGDVEVPEEVLTMAGDVPYGEYLASECAGCHQQNGNGDIPVIHGYPREAMITILFEYRAMARDNQAMQSVAGRLGDEEIVALAAYFEGFAE